MNDVQQEMARRKNNEDKLLDYLKVHGKATNVQLIQIAGIRFSARIERLRRKGHRIETVNLKHGLFLYKYGGHPDQVEDGQQLSMWGE